MNTAEHTAHTVGIEVGDYFTAGWGYDQTNIDFWQVVSIAKSGKTIQVVRCETEIVQALISGGQDDMVVPGEPVTDKPKRKTLRFWESTRRNPETDEREPYVEASFRTADWAGAPRPRWTGHHLVPQARQTNSYYGH